VTKKEQYEDAVLEVVEGNFQPAVNKHVLIRDVTAKVRAMMPNDDISEHIVTRILNSHGHPVVKIGGKAVLFNWQVKGA
jgi:hypothetical protein